MSRCRNLLSSFAILATALFFVAPVGIVAQSSEATCLSTFGWMNNNKGQSPCLVAAYLISVCNVAPFVVQSLPPTFHYNGPYATGQSQCGCSSVTYNAFSACAICQNATETNWSLWSFNCSTVYPGSYPPGVPSGTAVPQWMFQDVTKTDVFNTTLAQSVGDFPESTATQAQSSVFNSATAAGASASLTTEPIGSSAQTATPAPSGGGSKIGIIVGGVVGDVVGGVVGGVVGLLAIVGLAAFFLLRNKPSPQRLEREQMVRELELIAAEREHERARLDEAREAKVAALEVELARTRAELDKDQQVGPTDIIQPDQVLRQEMGAPMEEHWAEKRRWEERDGQMQELMEMVSRLLDEQAAPPRSPPSPPARRHQTWEEAPLRERVPEPRQVWYRPRPHIPPPLEDMPLARPPSRRPPRLQTWEEAPSPREPVPEPRQTWYRPRPRIPSLPEDMPPARPPSRRPPSPQTWEEAPPPREPVPEPVQVPSLVTWQPNPARSPTSLSVEPPQPLPDCGSPGLFGHTNRRNNSSPEPVRTPRGDWSSSPEPILPVPHSLSPSPDGYIPIG